MRDSPLVLRTRSVPPNLEYAAQRAEKRARRKHAARMNKLVSFVGRYENGPYVERWWIQSEWEQKPPAWDIDHYRQRSVRRLANPPDIFDISYNCRINVSQCGFKMIICPWCKSYFRLICDGKRCEFFLHVAVNHTSIFDYHVPVPAVGGPALFSHIITPYQVNMDLLMEAAWSADHERGLIEANKKGIELPLLIVQAGAVRYPICPYCRYSVKDYLLHYYRFHISFFGTCLEPDSSEEDDPQAPW